MSMWNEFKAFLLKENVLALAIAVVVGAALNKLVTAVVEDFIMPVVAVPVMAIAWLVGYDLPEGGGEPISPIWLTGGLTC